MSINEFVTEAQTWSVRFKTEAKSKFIEMGGTPQLSRWSFIVEVPENPNRTEGELLAEIHSLGVSKIREHCEKEGLKISLSDLQQFNNQESLNATRCTTS